jgi:propionyl-CoA synthetase
MHTHVNAYSDAYTQSLADPETFWGEAAGLVSWTEAPIQVLDTADTPTGRWFVDGTLNTSYNALDRHVAAGAGDRTALIYDSAMTEESTSLTYAELLDQVELMAGALQAEGLTKGDRVAIYLPMIPEAVVAMLACARLGAIHSVVFGGFAPAELAARINDAKPRFLITASGGLEPNRAVAYVPMVHAALELLSVPPPLVVCKRRQQFGEQTDPAWLDWDELIHRGLRSKPVPVASTDPLYILYTSGTSGKPKGVVRDTGGHAVALAWSMRNVYDVGAGETFFAASDIGWVVGHSYIVYGPLIAGATTVLYEGKPVGTPDAGAFWRLIEQHKVKVLFCAPTALRAIRKEDPQAAELAARDLSSLHTLFVAGERLDPDTAQWIGTHLKVPVVDHWWQTETGWPICANLQGLAPMPTKLGSPSVPVPGWDVQVLSATSTPQPAGVEGAITVRLPLPPGAMSGLWRDPERFASSYLSHYPGYYESGDSGYVDEDGYVFVLGRTDDVINVAGHRLSTGALEGAIAAHPDVVEVAVVGVDDELRGQRPHAYVVLDPARRDAPALIQQEVVDLVRQTVGPVAALKDVTVVLGLPKTRSGKVLRRTIRQVAEGREVDLPPTIEDVRVLDYLRDATAERDD